MTNKEAIFNLTNWKLFDKRIIDIDGDLGESVRLAIKALYLLVRLKGFKYVTTDVMLKEHEVAHFDIYKRGWNDAIQAVIDASDMLVTDIIKAIKENEVEGRE